MRKIITIFALILVIGLDVVAKDIFCSDKNVECAGDDVLRGGGIATLVMTLIQSDYGGFVKDVDGIVLTQVATEILKSSTHKSRPKPNENSHKSFPSGHASGAGQIAMFLTLERGWEYGVPAWIGAGFVAYSRVKAKKHYSEDVLAGLALGAGVQYWISRKNGGVLSQFIPYFSGDEAGVRYAKRF